MRNSSRKVIFLAFVKNVSDLYFELFLCSCFCIFKITYLLFFYTTTVYLIIWQQSYKQTKWQHVLEMYLREQNVLSIIFNFDPTYSILSLYTSLLPCSTINTKELIMSQHFKLPIYNWIKTTFDDIQVFACLLTLKPQQGWHQRISFCYSPVGVI